MEKKLMIGLVALALATGIGAAAGIKASTANNAIEAKAGGLLLQTATRLRIVDSLGWARYTVHFYDFNYESGYNKYDLEYYFADVYGARLTTDWAFSGESMGTTAWAYRNSEAANGDYLFRNFVSSDLASATCEHFIAFPWWVKGFKFHTASTNDWDEPYEIHSGWCYGESCLFELNKSSSYTHTWLSNDEYEFTESPYKVTVWGKTANLDDLGAATVLRFSKYDHFSANLVSLDGCGTPTLYTDYTCTSAYASARPTSDLELYGQFNSSLTAIANDKVRLWTRIFDTF